MNAAKNNKKFTKPVNKTFSLIVSGKDNHGHDYDPDSAIELIDDLVKNDVFTKLSIMASIANAALMGKEDARGMRNVARITTVNCEDKTVDMTFFGKNVEAADKLDEMVVVPRVRTARDDTKVETILYFEIVNPMEA